MLHYKHYFIRLLVKKEEKAFRTFYTYPGAIEKKFFSLKPIKTKQNKCFSYSKHEPILCLVF